MVVDRLIVREDGHGDGAAQQIPATHQLLGRKGFRLDNFGGTPAETRKKIDLKISIFLRLIRIYSFFPYLRVEEPKEASRSGLGTLLLLLPGHLELISFSRRRISLRTSKTRMENSLAFKRANFWRPWLRVVPGVEKKN